MGRPPRFFLLLILLTAVFGAGTVDVLFTDVVPIRPYSNVFLTNLSPLQAFKSQGFIGDIFGAILVVMLGSALFATVANLTTGRTIAHAGFTPNPNLTSSVGVVPIIQLIPFVFGAVVLLATYAVFERHVPGGL